MISERIKSKKGSPRAYYEKDKPTHCSNFQIRSRIFESSLRSRNIPGDYRGVTGIISGKEIVTLDGARGNIPGNHRGLTRKITGKETVTLDGARGDEL